MTDTLTRVEPTALPELLEPWERDMDRWIADLRSGNFNQTTANLFNGSSYCCLGVLCERVFEREFVLSGARYVIKHTRNGGSLEVADRDYLNLNRVVTAAERCLIDEKLGFDTSGNEIREHLLISFNDDHELSFRGIADAIELLRWHRKESLV